MKAHLCLTGLAALWLSGTSISLAQPLTAEHEIFERTRLSAEKGDPEAQLKLGTFYMNGTYVTRNSRTAVKWHRKAAEQGLAQAEYQLGLDYTEGKGVKEDETEAAKWIRRAADQGMVEAQLDIGLCYEDGRGVRTSGVEAVKWFRKAADQGFAPAYNELAKCYFNGKGVSRDEIQALKWLKMSAELGNPEAENRLALCYEKGQVVQKDLVQAYKWYNLAAAQDDENAADIRVSIAKLEPNMTKEQIAEAQQLAEDFKPGPQPSSSTNDLPRAVGSSTNSPAAPPPASAASGFVTVQSDDTSSEVFVDGAFVGNPPARLKLQPGSHVIEVKKAGFKNYRRELSVGGEAELNLRVALEKE